MSTNKYEEALRAAEKHFHVNSEECIRLAQHNLTDPLLPPYYDIQDCFLVASACDVWEDADVWRRAARQAHQTFHAKASRENDTAMPSQTIREARKQLDELSELLAEELDEFLKEERTDLPSTPPSEIDSVFWGAGLSDIGSDEGDGENESTLKLEDAPGESQTLDIPFRGRTVPPPEPKSTSTPKATTASTK